MSTIISLLSALGGAAFLKRKNQQVQLPILVFVLILIFCITVLVDFPLFYDDTLIEATGEKNEEALGSEVFLSGAIVNGEFINLSDSDISHGKWFWLNGNMYCWRPPTDERRAGDITEEISIHLPVCSNRSLVFDTNPWRGMVSINGDAYDLYSENQGTASYQLVYSKTLCVLNELFETLIYIGNHYSFMLYTVWCVRSSHTKHVNNKEDFSNNCGELGIK